MSDGQLDLLKEQLAPLSAQEKLELARFLTEQAKLDQATEQGEAVIDRAAADVKRTQHMAWLKAHREEYSGQYVALDGDRLVGVGLTIREAHEQARQHGVERPFLTHISSVKDAPVYFYADEDLDRNVLGRHGWLDRVVLGLIDYEGKLLLSPYGL